MLTIYQRESMGKFNLRKIVLMLADIFIIVVSGLTLNYVLALTKVIGPESNGMLLYYLVINLLSCSVMMFALGSYSRLWRYFDIKDYLACGFAMAAGFVIGFAVLTMMNMSPRKIFVLLYFIVATLGVMLFRFIFKKTFLELVDVGHNEVYERTLIVGAGNAARMILTEIENAKTDPNNPSKNIYPVCMVDDDTTKLHTKLNGVEIVGTCPEIPVICAKYHITNIISRHARRKKSAKSSITARQPSVKSRLFHTSAKFYSRMIIRLFLRLRK